MALYGPLDNKLVVLIGGGGFLGSHVAQDLLRCGARVRVAERHPESALGLKPLANLGQLQFARCNVADRRSLAACMQGADAVVYLVGTFGANQQALQAQGPGLAGQLAAEGGARAFVSISAIGANPSSESDYARTKGEGEERVRRSFPNATILRPSILFGENDNFINMFARLIASFPILPVFGPDARLQPLWVDDAAAAVVTALCDPATHGGGIYEIAGPDIITMGELQRRIAAAQGRSRRFIAMPDSLSALFASLPGTPMSSDQWMLLRRGSVASGELPSIAELGVTPKPLDLFLERWMLRYRKHGRFSTKSEIA